MLRFHPDKHIYESLDPNNKINWLSASKIPSYFKKIFEASSMAAKCSKNKKSKWYGIPPEEILQVWQNENIRSTTLGTWYHEKQELKSLSSPTTIYNGVELPIFPSIWEDGWKIAPSQKMIDGVYPEHLAFLSSAGICGQFDKMVVCNSFVDVDDYKSNKDLKKPTYVNWEGVTEKMLAPLLHLEANKINEYAIQLSIGMYMVLRHNPNLKPGKMTLTHVTFELDGEDKYGYPITRLDSNNEPIVKDVEKIPVPYLKREVEIIIDWLKQKRNLRHV